MADLVWLDHREPMTKSPAFSIETDPSGGNWCVRVRGLDPGLVNSRCGSQGSMLRVEVVKTSDFDGELPSISGDCQVLDDGIRFVPHFPFEKGVLFRAVLDLGVLPPLAAGEALTHKFSFPAERPNGAPEVTQVYPSGSVLPENLLRFYVRFSCPIRRGCVEDHVEILGADGSPAPDILYRAPVELWDRRMTCLMVLLDPGRLKRGVGPNRMLGPPLKAGQRYALRIGPGMIDMYGRPLQNGFVKSFNVSEAIRQAIAIDAWGIRPPTPGSHEPLEVTFPRPLDWAQLWHGIAVALDTGEPVGGRIDIDMEEQRWRLTPDLPWRAGVQRVCVSPTLEDVCGNTPSAPFDKLLSSPDDMVRRSTVRSLAFVVQGARRRVHPAPWRPKSYNKRGR